jgi:hypothetical protein
MSSTNAFWRIAPSVRFIAFEIFTTGVFFLECIFNARTSAADHATRLVRPFAFVRRLAIVIPFSISVKTATIYLTQRIVVTHLNQFGQHHLGVLLNYK